MTPSALRPSLKSFWSRTTPYWVLGSTVGASSSPEPVITLACSRAVEACSRPIDHPDSVLPDSLLATWIVVFSSLST